MSASDQAPRTRGDSVLSSSILVASVLGSAAAWLPWHKLATVGVETRGISRVDGRVVAGALAFGALLVTHHLLTRRPLFAKTLVVATLVAAGADGAYFYVMIKPESQIHELVKTALEGTFCPGSLIAGAMTLAALVLAVVAVCRPARV